MPYSMIEPLREVLDSGVQSDRAEQDDRWLSILKDGLQDAEVELTTVLGQGSVQLSRLVDMKPGDVLPCDFAGKATVLAEGVPLFRGAFGVSRGQQCVRMNATSESTAAATRDGGQDVNLDVILDVPVTLSMEVGRTRIPIRNLLQLNQGSVVELDRAAGEPLDVFVNGTLVAHGEVVVVNEKFGIRITDVVSPAERIRKLK
jgi:flagellar motor switch protein FliN